MTQSNEFDLFSNWVHNHLENNFDQSSEQDFRFESNQSFLKQLKKILHDRADQSAPIDTDMMRYLYLTWTTFSANSDMAGTVSLDRIKPLNYLNQGHTLTGFFPFTLLNSNHNSGNKGSFVSLDTSSSLTFLLSPTVSGISINAP